VVLVLPYECYGIQLLDRNYKGELQASSSGTTSPSVYVASPHDQAFSLHICND